MLVYAVSLDRNQAGPYVRRADANLDRVAACVCRLIELYLEFGIAIERFRKIRLACYAVGELVQFGPGSVPQDENKIAGLRGRQREVASSGRDTDLAAVPDNFFRRETY